MEEHGCLLIEIHNTIYIYIYMHLAVNDKCLHMYIYMHAVPKRLIIEVLFCQVYI